MKILISRAEYDPADVLVRRYLVQQCEIKFNYIRKFRIRSLFVVKETLFFEIRFYESNLFFTSPCETKKIYCLGINRKETHRCTVLGAIFAMVARSASVSEESPGPKNSTNFPTTPFFRSICVIVSTRSVAVVPGFNFP